MRLKDAARRFHDALAIDAYTGDELFRCSFTSFDDHSATGATARRRVLNLPEGIDPPARNCIQLYDEIWIVGSAASDSFGGSIIRRSFNMKRATELARIGTPGQALAATGVQAFVQKQYFKEAFDAKTTAEIDIFWNVFLAQSEAIDVGSFVVTPDRVLRVRRTYLPVDGLRVAESDELDADAAVTAAFTSNGAYNAVTDSFPTVAVSTPAYLVDFNKLYTFDTQADVPYQQGDKILLVPKSALTPVVGSQCTVGGLSRRVLQVRSELDCWLLHVRIG